MSLYYEDDQVTLYHGNCLTEYREWLDADVLVTDPPYGMAYELSSSSRVRGELPIIGDNNTETRDRAIGDWGARPALVFGTWRVKKPRTLKNVLIWDKGNSLGMGMSNPWGLSHEEIYVLGDWPKLSPGGRIREGGVPSRVPSVVRASQPNNASVDREKGHPTPKPIGLMSKLIARCPPGTIADPFAGSGSTLLAAKGLGRKSIGVELNERYCEIIAKRCAQGVLDFGALA